MRLSALHDARVAAHLGAALGVCFGVVFLTGIFSHLLQHPGPLTLPALPAATYRVTQGVHVITGVATGPLLLAKLWTVYPKFWAGLRELRDGLPRPGAPARRAGQWLSCAAGRGMLIPLTGGAIFQLVTGLANIAYWYPFPFFFTVAHYWTAYIVVGALIVHVTNEWTTARHALSHPTTAGNRQEGTVREALAAGDSRSGEPGESPPAGGEGERAPGEVLAGTRDGLSRRGFLWSVGGASGVLVATTVGEVVTPVRKLAVLAPRRDGAGQRGLPVNRSAVAAGIAVPDAYRLRVRGAVAREKAWSLNELNALPRHTMALPIACVEGWSAGARWTGVRVRDLLRAAGAPEDATVRMESLERGGRYRTSELSPPQWHDPAALVALRCDGEVLTLDHGYPCRLIAPGRPGVLQTKWLAEIVVTGRAS